ncbi:hypothetical protein QSV34_05840 [Porticoccus sp. W117]|uniref:hypothetical protein n=1 Tax=Porticoccus sp. W117 TaxID=3054777 RepID=UPI002597E5A4|nr:hypothetical protein [Porticoccus sp. W117]MDM3870873.1 hypothetical protein [Porticoccus sp. W117]
MAAIIKALTSIDHRWDESRKKHFQELEILGYICWYVINRELAEKWRHEHLGFKQKKLRNELQVVH